MSIEPTVYELSSRVPLIEAHDTSRQTALISFTFGVGARHEEPSVNGISHFIEHIAFKGTKQRAATEIKTTLSDMGASYNALTSRDRTRFYVDVLREDVPNALRILSDISLNLCPPESEVKTERGAIIQEIKSDMDNASEVAGDEIYRLAFPKQGLGQTILGPLENIQQGISYQDLMDFKDAKYTASNLRIAITGNYDQGITREVLEEYTQDLPMGQDQERLLPKYNGGDNRIEMSREQVAFRLAFNSPTQLYSEEIASDLLSSIMGGSMSSRLFQEIREKRGLVYEIWSANLSHTDTGLFIAGGLSDAENIGQTVSILTDELKKAVGSITQKELDRAKRKIKVETLRNSELLQAQAGTFETSLRTQGRIMTFEEEVAISEAVTLDDIHRVANSIFSSNPTFVAVGPIANTRIPSYDEICNQLRY